MIARALRSRNVTSFFFGIVRHQRL
jgi:hypothetical protein